MVAVDKDGCECVGHRRGGNNYNFNGLNYKDVKEFRFQTRYYLWAEFPNVSLVPKSKMD